MNYIICKTFWRQDEVLVHEQWDLEMGREGEERGARKREKKRLNEVTTYGIALQFGGVLFW